MENKTIQISTPNMLICLPGHISLSHDMIICEKLMHGHPPLVSTLHSGHQMRKKIESKKFNISELDIPKHVLFRVGGYIPKNII